jgi:predicted nicotinamide N-methyase
MSVQKEIYALKRELAARYQLGEEHHNICGRKIGVTCVEDAEALFDKLGMADPDSFEVRDERLPYWATLWDSALILSGVLLADNLIAPGESVLELGCGLGLVSSIACLKHARVTATDYQRDALKFAQLNGLQIAGVAPRTMFIDWRAPPQGQHYATLLGADLVYEPRFFDSLIAAFDALLAPGGRVLFSEPNRIIGRSFFDRLHSAGWAFSTISEREGATVYEIVRRD